MNRPPEFAEQYTRKERIRILLAAVAAGLIAILIGKSWGVPWLQGFAASAPCRTVLGVNGASVLWYGVFVGIPLSGAVAVIATFGRRGRRILMERQVPLREEKVFRLTRIHRGKRAALVGYLHLLAFVPFVMLMVWGIDQAAGLSAQVQTNPIRCAGNSPSEPTPHRASD